MLRTILAAIVVATLAAPAGADPNCDRLRSLKIPNATIAAADSVAAGAFVQPSAPGLGGRGGNATAYADLPAFCRVAATLTPSSDSDIKIEVWLPAADWNRKFLAVGNGGWSGAVGYPALASSLKRGYATASTDTGHAGGSGSFALGHPEKLTDFAYRAVHEMTVNAKAIIEAYYNAAPRLSYWTGCSSGGKQGLKEAQKYPNDYDGIVAGAPANFWTHLVTQSLWVAQATLKDPASLIPRGKFETLNNAALAACDANDGVKDGLIENPARCAFDPGTIQCSGADAPGCLTAPQVEAARTIYAPAKNPRTGAVIFPGMARGSELGWPALAGGPRPLSIAEDHYKYVVFKNAEWDFRTLNFDEDVALADATDAGAINATDPDLSAFAAHSGKLILYHGWSDQLIAPQNSIDYYTKVRNTVGAAQTEKFVRLFMAPGMMHCAGGPGPNTFDSQGAIEQWVEHGTAPEKLLATHSTGGAVDRTRPLCAYPKVAVYTGSGDVNDAANFDCKAQ
ncbi:MAG TPA: tannase/feruloyl esterase family alpha/beta hydrolase [Vicinamibacterales bacterium]|nr:tannase/feruloyl esterase family alpha/beta hydrolase [Vicinamibacterales bacterium]